MSKHGKRLVLTFQVGMLGLDMKKLKRTCTENQRVLESFTLASILSFL